MAIVDVIKCEVNDWELVCKFPSDKIRLGSQLVVYPAQTAFFVKGGKICDEFTSGTYTIKSENIPLLDKIINLPFGGNSPFQAEVWFINQIALLDCKWGTQTPLQIEDPQYKVIVSLRAFGQYGFKVVNPRLFLERLVGNMTSFTVSKLEDYFRGVIHSNLTSILYEKLCQENISTLTVNSRVDMLSGYAKQRLTEVFHEYGIEIELFNIMSISLKEDDPSFQRLKEAKDLAARIKIIGRDDYRMTRSFDVLEKAAENEGDGMINTAIGIGAGVTIGNQIGAMAAEHISTQVIGENEIPPVPVEKYYLAISGKQEGPFTMEQIESKYTQGRISRQTLVWKKGMKTWAKLKELADFKHLLDEECPPPLPRMKNPINEKRK